MGFAAPWVWLALLSAAVPLWVHLAFKPHATGKAVPSLMFLHEHEVKQARARQLRDRFLLLLRLLVLAALTAAMAGPFITGASADRQGPAAVVLVVDQSASMGAQDTWSRTREALGGLRDTLLAERIPVAMLGSAAISRQVLDFTTDRDAIAAAFSSMQPRPEPGRLRAALQNAVDLLNDARLGVGRIVLVSDLQRSGFTEGQQPVTLDGHTLDIIDVGGGQRENLEVAALQWLPSADAVEVAVHNPGSSAIRGAALTVSVDGHDVAREVVSLAPATSRSVQVRVTPAPDRSVTVIARLDDPAFAYDNQQAIVIPAVRDFDVVFDASVAPAQLMSALTSFQEPRLRLHTGSTVPRAVDLLVRTGIDGDAAARAGSARAVLALAVNPADGTNTQPVAPGVAASLGLVAQAYLDTGTLASELQHLAEALATLNLPEAVALEEQDSDRVMMRWTDGSAAALVRELDGKRTLTLGVAPGAGLDTLGRTAVFAPLLRELVLAALNVQSIPLGYTPGEAIVQPGSRNGAGSAGALVSSPDGKQVRWVANTPFYAPFAPGMYQVFEDGSELSWRFWVRHDRAEAAMAAMTAEQLRAFTLAGDTAGSTAAKTPAGAQAREQWWWLALCIALTAALLEAWFAMRRPVLENTA